MNETTLEQVKEWISQFKLNLSPKTLKIVAWLIQEVERLEAARADDQDFIYHARMKSYEEGREAAAKRCMEAIAEEFKITSPLISDNPEK